MMGQYMQSRVGSAVRQTIGSHETQTRPKVTDWISGVTSKFDDVGWNVTGMDLGLTEDGSFYVKDISVYRDQTEESTTAETQDIYQTMYESVTGNWTPKGRNATIFDYMMGGENYAIHSTQPSEVYWNNYYQSQAYYIHGYSNYQYNNGGRYNGNYNRFRERGSFGRWY